MLTEKDLQDFWDSYKKEKPKQPQYALHPEVIKMIKDEEPEHS